MTTAISLDSSRSQISDPRPVSTGVGLLDVPPPYNSNQPVFGESSAAEAMRFDWYQGTVREEEFGTYPDRVIPLLEEKLSTVHTSWQPGLHGYESMSVLRHRDGSVGARVLHGGRNRWPNVTGSGDRSPELAAVMRELWPDAHLVTRADVAYDVQGSGSFDKLCELLLSVADARNLRVSQAGDWRGGVAGRTLYVGSRKSSQFVRLYEKGLEQRGKAATVAAAAAIPEDWTRLELCVKPDKPGRRSLASKASEEELWGFTLWTREVAARVMQLDVERVQRGSLPAPNDAEHALSWAMRQYSNHITTLEETWGEEAVWAWMKAEVRSHQRAVNGEAADVSGAVRVYPEGAAV